jgi:hypothetical protein
MGRIIRDYGQPMVNGDAGNQQVDVANGATLTA